MDQPCAMIVSPMIPGAGSVASMVRMRAAGAVIAVCCLSALLSAALCGCGKMTTEDYSNAIYSINLRVEEEMNALAARMQEQAEGGMREISLDGMRVSRRIEDVFRSSLEEAQGMSPPSEARSLHADILELYRLGMELGEDFSAAYEYLYEISDVLDGFFSRGLEVFKVGVLGGERASLLSALDRDISTAKDGLGAVDAESGDAAPAARDFFRGIFSGLLDILERARTSLISEDPEARQRLNQELSDLFAGILLEQSQGMPGFAELFERLLELRDRYHELARMVNDL